VWAVLLLATVGCGDSTDDASSSDADDATRLPDTTTVVNVLQTDERFSTLATALDSTDLDSVLAANGPYTLFAPTNAAFSRLPDGTVPDLLNSENQDRLRSILLYHTIEGRMKTQDVSAMTILTTMEGSTVPVSADDGTVRVGNATVVDGDIDTGNGVIHVLDSVLRPPPDGE
jgi:uncharacterized surface protein with fasciclin (FAS1) repeats